MYFDLRVANQREAESEEGDVLPAETQSAAAAAR
jgi:hypothetical protein